MGPICSYNLVNLDTSTPLTMPAITRTTDLSKFIPSEIFLDNTSDVKTSRPVNLHSLLYSECEKPVTAEYSKFETIKSQLLKDGKLYEDDSFFTEDFFEDMIVRRPKEICDEPKFYVGEHSRFDVNQGQLGDSWFLAALAGLAMNKKLFSQVVPQGQDQSFDDGVYVGMFRFRFWRFGEWVEVIIDDRLPTSKTEKELIYNKSTEKQEFWSPLFEKAYAKFRGMTYKAIAKGSPIVAMQNFTGGLTEVYSLSDAPIDLFTILLKACEKNALIVCSTGNDPDQKPKTELEKAEVNKPLVYSAVTKVINLETGKDVVQLLRIRNPLGGAEWSGAWSDSSPEWRSIPDTKKQELDFNIKNDGEFWMSYGDFIKNYNEVQLCHLHSDSADPENQLKISSIKGKWIKGVTAGGHKDWVSFSSNPQYQITLTEPDEGNAENKCEITVGLTQKDGADSIGIYVHLLPITANLPRPINCDVFESSAPRRNETKKLTEKSYRLTLAPGSYVIIPCTEEPDQEDEFLLRVMSQKNIQITEYDGDLHIDAPEQKVTMLLNMGVNFPIEVFNQYALTDHTMGVEAFKQIFNTAFSNELGKQKIENGMIEQIMGLADFDRSDNLSYNEFRVLWLRLKQWQTAFNLCGTDVKSTIPKRNLRAALRAAGWTVNVEFIQRLITSFKLTNETISYVDFINCIRGAIFVDYKRRQALQLPATTK